MVIFPARNANIYKIGELHKTIYFLIVQQFATKLCNFTHFKMLFLAMVMASVLLVKIEISSIAGIIYFLPTVAICYRLYLYTGTDEYVNDYS